MQTWTHYAPTVLAAFLASLGDYWAVLGMFIVLVGLSRHAVRLARAPRPISP